MPTIYKILVIMCIYIYIYILRPPNIIWFQLVPTMFKLTPCISAISPRRVKMNCDVRSPWRYRSFLYTHTHTYRHSSSPFRLYMWSHVEMHHCLLRWKMPMLAVEFQIHQFRHQFGVRWTSQRLCRPRMMPWFLLLPSRRSLPSLPLHRLCPRSHLRWQARCLRMMLSTWHGRWLRPCLLESPK